MPIFPHIHTHIFSFPWNHVLTRETEMEKSMRFGSFAISKVVDAFIQPQEMEM
jgi:hypothetical protein